MAESEAPIAAEESERPSLAIFLIKNALTGRYLGESEDENEPFAEVPFEEAIPFRSVQDVEEVIEIMLEAWKAEYKASQLYMGRTPPAPKHLVWFSLAISEPSAEDIADAPDEA